MKTLSAGRAVRGASTLAELTTMQVGGPIAELVEAETEEQVLEAVRRADAAGLPLLAIGGGSNIVGGDAPFEGIVLRDLRDGFAAVDIAGGVLENLDALENAGAPENPEALENPDSSENAEESRDPEQGQNHDGRVWVEATAEAGMGWDEFVAATLEQGLSGLEALSGIPGTVGAAPVQNIGAYGHDVAETLVRIRAFDRQTGDTVVLEADSLDFGYRTSALKRSIRDGWGPSPRWIVLSATFRLERSEQSMPIAYGQLAASLGVQAGERAAAKAVREAVLALRASKGMVLDDADRDTYSCGSFYTNPVLTEAEAAKLPEEAPKFAAGSKEVGAAAPGEGLVKTSAAWLIDHAGFPAGYAMPGPAALSTKHCLALTNRGGATGADIRALSAEVVAGVRERFGVELVPEPILL